MAILLQLVLVSALFAQDADYVFRAETELVLVNVSVRDKDGNFVRDLKPEDFTVLEDGKQQKVVSFDIENTDAVSSSDVAQVKLLNTPPKKSAAAAATPQAEVAAALGAFKDRRLIILFFDLSAMEPDEIDHSVTAAQNYVDKQMAPADWWRWSRSAIR